MTVESWFDFQQAQEAFLLSTSSRLAVEWTILLSIELWEAVLSSDNINHLKPTGHVMHQQFKIQQLYALPTLYLCVLYLSENKQRLVPLTA